MPRPSEGNPSRFRPADVLGIAIGVVFVIAGVFAVAAPWSVRSRDLGIDANGSSAAGTIEAVAPPLAGGDGEFTISYWFVTASGAEQHASRSVTEGFWRAANVGQPVEVRYDPDRPANNHPAGFGETSIGLAIFVSAIGAVVGGVGLTLLIAIVRRQPAPSATEGP